MYQRGIRGAITIDSDNENDVRKAVIELISEIKKKNEFDDSDISSVLFTLTDDIKCIYPAKIAREEFKNWDKVPMMCVQEMKIENSLPKCMRTLIVINTTLSQDKIKHVYLKGAEVLRKDII